VILILYQTLFQLRLFIGLTIPVCVCVCTLYVQNTQEKLSVNVV
jgi:hypothetical protein